MAVSKTVSGQSLASGYEANPQHIISLTEAAGSLSVMVDSGMLAQVNAPIILKESNYPPVYYCPRDSFLLLDLEKLEKTSWCPFKGMATYYKVTNEQKLSLEAWSYEDPFEQLAEIKDHLAFYPEKAEFELNDR